MKLKHFLSACVFAALPHTLYAGDAPTETNDVSDILRVIKNDIKDALPSLSHAETVRINHEIPCARDFKNKALAASELISFTAEVSDTALKHDGWNEIAEFDVGYGESAYILPIGKIKYGETHPPVVASNAIKFARKINGRIGAEIRYREDPVRVASPDSEVVKIVWRFLDSDHGDNVNVDLRFAYFVYGGLGSMETHNLEHPCDY
ncbi:hypothetical protein NBRC116590_38940 [Pelagimonas sp. KU-00592-HH]|uniref:hypothetical protein n=1 Tax=Pelagimonas sp. KU-00592-HH TaxID=3127651 RepID=UPI003108B065